MLARDIMTEDPVCCTVGTTIREAARLMKQNDCGCIPVVEEGSRQLIGVVTDRDIAVRGVADGLDPTTVVDNLMTKSPACCSPESDLAEVEQIMAERQVRRVPVTDAEGRCVGIVAQADLALAENQGVSETEVGQLVERISETQTRKKKAVQH